MKCHSRLATLLMLAVHLEAASASAQTEDPSPKVTASIQLGKEARELFARGDYPAAYERFVLAERLTHSPVFTLHMARCLRHIGKLLAAHDEYVRTATEHLPPDAPSPWLVAQADARAELASVERDLPRLELTLVGTSLETTVIDVDGVRINHLELRLDPGLHRVVARHRGATRSWQLQLREGSRMQLNVHFDSSQPASLPPRSVEPLDSDRPPSLRTWAWLGLGIGALGLGTGIASGSVAWAQRQELTCSGNECASDDARAGQTARVWADVATVGFIVGGIGAATGITLFLSEPRPRRATQSTSLRATALGIEWKTHFD